MEGHMTARTAKSARLCAIWGLCAALLVLSSPATCSAEEITIDVAPNTLNLQSEGKVVTVHTDIAYWAVDVSSVYINGVAIASWKADNRGNFVAKFSMDEVKNLDGLIIDGYNTLQLVGLTTDGEPFWGEQDILVIDEGSSGS
jgi:hypothetical protein